MVFAGRCTVSDPRTLAESSRHDYLPALEDSLSFDGCR
jgi:hypothetical protein